MLARCALVELSLDAVLLMPAYTPPHKQPGPALAAPEQRLAMCELAAAGEQGVRACDLEVRRGGPSYTVDTLEEIHHADPHARLTLILGADMALTLASWRAPKRLLELADLAIAKRTGAGSEQVLGALAPLHPMRDRVRFLRMPPIDVSSSTVREHLTAGLAIEGMLPPPVKEYIAKHGLYAAGVA